MNQRTYSLLHRGVFGLQTVFLLWAFVGACARREEAPRLPAAPSVAVPVSVATGAGTGAGSDPRIANDAAIEQVATSSERSQRLACLARLYGLRFTNEGFLAQSEGSEPIPYDDGKTKSDAERIESADLEDTFAWPYEHGELPLELPGTDPGRARNLALLRAAYGANKKDVERALVSVDVFGQSLSVHEKVRDALLRVIAHLEPVKIRPDVRAVFTAIGGTYNARKIAETDRMSPHAFGIAIDLAVKRSRYWRDGGSYKNEIPKDVVLAFEAEGFIWGGRWKHFDTMHFEYRPEFFDTACFGQAGIVPSSNLP
jgi:D-alanyl-D-alanine carboxypeptidase